MSDVYIVNDFTGVQKGTKSNPYSAKIAKEWDGLIASLLHDENGVVVRQRQLFVTGEFDSAGCYEWGPFASPERPRVGPEWQFILSKDTVINLDPNAIPDGQVNDWPLHLFCSTGIWQEYLWKGRDAEWAALAPEDVWKQLPSEQLINGGKLNLNYSKFIDRWRAAGKALKLSGGLLTGHGGSFEDVTVKDFGAWHVIDQDGKLVGAGAESFPLISAGAADGFDRNKIAKLDPSKYIFSADLPNHRCPHHTGCKFEDFQEADSNDQVSLCVISGSVGQPSLPANSAGDEVAPFVEHWHKWAYQTNNPIGDFPGAQATRNQLQAFTIYLAQGGEVAFNGGSNMNAGYYSDFYKSKKIDVHDNNWKRVLRGAAWLLSPVGPDCQNFSSQGHKFRRNKITLLPVANGADWNGGVLLWKFEAEGPNRFLSDFTIGGPGDENEISLDGSGGSGYAVNAVNADTVRILENKFGSLPVRTTNCTNVIRLSWWRKFIYWLKNLF